MFLGEAFQAVSIESKSDLATYEEAMADVNLAHWVKAMKAELESTDSNQVWNLVELLTNIKAISGSTRGKEDRMEMWRPSKQGWWLRGLLKKRALIMRKLSRL